jgi:uncharacterized protein YkwD
MVRSLPAAAFLFVLAPAVEGKPEKAPKEKDSPEVKLSAAEQGIIEMANKERAKEKLPALKVNALLCKAAKMHSDNMAKQGKMEHVLDGKDPRDRVVAAGYSFRSVGENVARAGGRRSAPVGPIHRWWMNSKPHRKNILDPNFTEVGVSVARSKRGVFYYTVVFGAPEK